MHPVFVIETVELSFLFTRTHHYTTYTTQPQLRSPLSISARRCHPRPAGVAREAKEGLTPAAGEETDASRRPRRRRWRHEPIPRRGVRGRERHSPRRTGRALTRAGRRTAASAPPATATTPGLVALGGWLKKSSIDGKQYLDYL